jgi:hypothetical protein
MSHLRRHVDEKRYAPVTIGALAATKASSLGVQPDDGADTFAQMLVGEPDCAANEDCSRCVLGGGAGSTWSGWLAGSGVIAAYSTAQRRRAKLS